MSAICSYKDCFTARQAHSQITFFNLPTDPKRREEWIRNSGPDNLNLQNLSEKSKRVFCEKHFDEKYKRRQFHRVTLHPTAVPLKYGEERDENQKENSVMMSFEEDVGEESQVQEVFVLNLIEDRPLQSRDEDSVELETPQNRPVILNKDVQSRKRVYPFIYREPTRGLKKVRVLRAVPKSINIESARCVNESQKKAKAASMVEGSCQTELTEMYDKSVQVDPEKALSSEAATQTDQIPEESNDQKSENTKQTPKIDDEDSYFCVKVIAEAMKRLSPKKKAEAKLHMISYMFGLEHS